MENVDIDADIDVDVYMCLYLHLYLDLDSLILRQTDWPTYARQTNEIDVHIFFYFCVVNR